MLKKTQRLRTAGFNEVFAVGKRLHTPYFQIIFVRSTDFHCAVVVGKKVHKTAVARNRLRRQMYASIYRFSKVTPLPFTMIVVAKPSCVGIHQRAVSSLVHEMLQELVRTRQ